MLLLFLALTTAGAQEKGDSLIRRTWILPDFSHWIYWGDKHPKPIPIDSIIKDAILTLYSRYEVECYRDSTAVTSPPYTIYRGSGPCSAFISRINMDQIKIIRWDHRQPTFPGFIQYLRGKK